MPIVWRGRRARAFVPALLAERDLTLDTATVARTTTAAVQVGHSAAELPEDYAPLARLLLRAEGVASSYIEGVRAPAVDIVLAEADGAADQGGVHTPAAWVAANLAATVGAVQHAALTTEPLSVILLCDWHAALMAGSPTPARYVGVVRDEQGWIGPWIRWFADAVSGASQAQVDLLAEVRTLQARWATQLGAVRGNQQGASRTGQQGGRVLRRDAAAWRLLKLLPRQLVLTAPAVAAALDITPKAAADALKTLAAAGILTPHGRLPAPGRGRPAPVYVSVELLALAGASPLR